MTNNPKYKALSIENERKDRKPDWKNKYFKT